VKLDIVGADTGAIAAIELVADVVVIIEPTELVAVIVHVMVLPTSAVTNVYVLAVAPDIADPDLFH